MNSKNITEDFYNKFQNALEFSNRTINYDMKSIYNPFIEQIELGGHILDAGCGPGRDSLYFIKNGYKVTAIDASNEMVMLASKLTNQSAIKMRFQEMDFINEFDGIWANASLLHVSKLEMPDVIKRLLKGLKNGGILFASFKYGNKEEDIDGRFFNFYDEYSWNRVIKDFPSLKQIKIEKSEDTREDHKNEYWLLILLRKEIKNI
jgi:SAM-dependent methyltransferase